MRLQLLTLFVPAIAGFIIPDPEVAYQLALNQLNHGHSKQLNTAESTQSSNALSEAFQDAYKHDAPSKTSKTSPVADWFKKALELIDPLDNMDVDSGRADGDCSDFGKHRRDSTLWELIEDCPEASNFADLASKVSDFHNLLKDPKQNVTVFVPTNSAFDRFFESTNMDKDKIPKDFLADLMNYHSVIGGHPSCDLMCRNTIASRMHEDKLGKGVHQRLRIGVTRNRKIFMNMFAEVRVKDVVCSTLHCVSRCLLTWPSSVEKTVLFMASMGSLIHHQRFLISSSIICPRNFPPPQVLSTALGSWMNFRKQVAMVSLSLRPPTETGRSLVGVPPRISFQTKERITLKHFSGTTSFRARMCIPMPWSVQDTKVRTGSHVGINTSPSATQDMEKVTFLQAILISGFLHYLRINMSTLTSTAMNAR